MLRFVHHTQLDTPHPVGILRTSDQLVADAAYMDNTQQTQDTNIYSLIGIRTRDPSNRPVANLRLRRHDHSHHNRPTLRKFDGVQKDAKLGGWRGTISVNHSGAIPNTNISCSLNKPRRSSVGKCTVSVISSVLHTNCLNLSKLLTRWWAG